MAKKPGVWRLETGAAVEAGRAGSSGSRLKTPDFAASALGLGPWALSLAAASVFRRHADEGNAYLHGFGAFGKRLEFERSNGFPQFVRNRGQL